MNGTLSAILADDHPPTRASVRGALERAGFDVRAEAWDADGAVSAALAHRPNVALLDIRMPGGGIQAASRIAAGAPESAIVMLTVSNEDVDLFAALRAGATGYLIKGMVPNEIPKALQRVLNGEAVLPGTLVAWLVEEFRRRDRRRTLTFVGQRGSRLTDREWEVLELLDRGRTTAQIAAELYIATVTVRSHISAILRKLQVADREAALRLLRQGQAG
ncbi:MAG: response regulator [Acidimicrobiales bacterium]